MPGGDAAVAELVVDGAIDLAWTEAFRDLALDLGRRDDLRAVVIRSEGRFFCPGGDLAWMAAQSDRHAALHMLATNLHAGVLALQDCAAPVIARVNGPAAGAGLSLVLAADIAVAGHSASFTVAYAGVGLSPDGGASWFLPRLVGRRLALDLMLTNRRVEAEEAASLGIVTRAVPDDDLDAAIDHYVAAFRRGPTRTYEAIKRLTTSSSQTDLAAQLEAEAAVIAGLADSPTGREGAAAFLEKRRPVFP